MRVNSKHKSFEDFEHVTICEGNAKGKQNECISDNHVVAQKFPLAFIEKM